MYKRELYSSGLPFDKTLGENLKDLVARVKGNKAALLIVDGGVGEGKTTLKVEAADFINKLYDLPEITLKTKEHPQLCLGGKEFLKGLRNCYEKDLPVIIYDEAGDFNRRGSLTRFNAMINRCFETFRGFKIIVILGLPSFHVLDNDLFDKNIPRLLVHLSDRNEKYGMFRAYSLYRMMYIKQKMGKLVVKPFAYDLVEPNFRGHFLDLPMARSKALDKISTEGKLNVLRESEIKAEGLVTYTDLANKLSRSYIWIRKTMVRLKIKETRIIKKVKYFNQETANRLTEFLEEGGLTKENEE